jgi:transcriptional regulator with XRE-family HTH domain
MKDRIRRIIEQEGLSQSEFALKLGVQRSNISHILSGRNKPSMDFVQKLLINFPNINSDWLILGKGNMYKKQEKTSEKPENIENSNEKTNVNTNIDINLNSVTKENKEENKERQEQKANSNQNKEKIISLPEQILVLYDDHTFITYKKR